MGEASEKQLLVAFGTNQSFGDLSPEGLIIAASEAVEVAFDAKISLSSLFRTPCFPAGAGPDYVNAAAKVTLRHEVTPEQVLQTLHQIEGRFGRVRGARWVSRTLDIDLLAVSDAVLPDEATHAHWRNLALEEQASRAPDQLILPHPRLQDRAFVLVPLAEVAPDWRHPALGKTVVEMLAALPAEARAEVHRLNPAASD